MIDSFLDSLRRGAHWALRTGLLLLFVVAVAACGGAGSNGGGNDDDGTDSDSKYPEPPNRPSAVTVDAQPRPHV
jgi:hypothetical protein